MDGDLLVQPDDGPLKLGIHAPDQLLNQVGAGLLLALAAHQLGDRVKGESATI